MIFKNIIVLAFLIIASKSDKDYFLPMEKESRYGSDVCRYYDEGRYYVKPCEKGKYCVGGLTSSNIVGTHSELEICQDLPKINVLSNLNEGKCKTTLECEGSLECNGNTCTDCSSPYYTNSFPRGDYPYDCEDVTNKGSGYCESVTLDASNNPTSKYSSPESYKKCGKLTIKEYPNTASATFTGIYYTALNEYTYIGTVADGEYVKDPELCESGFALPFYYGGYFDDPRSSSATASGSTFQNHQYLRCVTPISVNKRTSHNACSITYKIGEGEELNYNIDKVYGWGFSINDYCNEDFIKIKYDHFREYSKSITEDERKTCGDLDNTNKYTCENNGLIKSWYFYQNPSKYILYNGREKLEKVLNYLIQKEYPSYSFSKFLNYNIIFLLILFLL